MAKSLTLISVPAYGLDWLILVNVRNPKRPGTACYDRFERLASCDTVAEYAKAEVKGYRAELNWCAARGFITLVDPADVAVDAEVAAEMADSVNYLRAELEAKAEVEAAEAEALAELGLSPVPAEAE